MSEEPVANNGSPDPASPDAGYEAIHVTLSETAQGRRFLEEYARRSRAADLQSSLAAIERIQAMQAESSGDRVDIRPQLSEIAEALARTRAETDAILQQAGHAATDILTAAAELRSTGEALRAAGASPALCNRIEAQVARLDAHPGLQDLTGERGRRVLELLNYLDQCLHLAAQEDSAPAPVRAEFEAQTEPEPEARAEAEAEPAVALHEERQDATLEDISKKMLALEPGPAAPVPVPPEAEPVPEAEPTCRMLQWAVELGAPPERKAETEPSATAMADWVVEDADAPRPESEPAWMILQRMQLQIDPERATAPSAPAVTVLAEPTISPPPPPSEDPDLFSAESMSQLAQTLRPGPLLPPPELSIRSRLSGADALAELQDTIVKAEMNLIPAEDQAEEPSSPADGDSPEGDGDDFLFEPERSADVSPPHNSPLLPGPALSTPSAPARTEEVKEQEQQTSGYDPLAPLRALSDAQKIALFS